MAWIEAHQSLWTHKKTFRLAAKLGIDETTAGGHLVRFWGWALDNAGDGFLDEEPEIIAFGAGWRGDASLFVDALVAAGWLDAMPGGYEIHDWHDYAGKLLDKRKAERERSAQRRAEKQPPVDRRSTGQRPAVDQETTVGTVPNRTQPNQTVPAPTELEAAAVAAKPAEPKPAKRITEEFRERMREKYPGLNEPEEYDKATNHTAYRKAIDKQRYYETWLKRSLEFQAEARTNGRTHQPTRTYPGGAPGGPDMEAWARYEASGKQGARSPG